MARLAAQAIQSQDIGPKTPFRHRAEGENDDASCSPLSSLLGRCGS